MKVKAIRKCKFDAGHRVVNHESKCRTLHGHEYWAHIYAEGDELDSIGRVIDFSEIKNKVGGWLDKYWDHNMIIWEKDPNLKYLLQCDGLKKPFVTTFNPTAENMAEYLIKEICPQVLVGTGIKVTKIKLFETTNCYVEVTI